MTIPAMLSHEAEAAAQRYAGLIAGWRGLYADQLASAGFGSPRALAAAREEAYRLARSYLDSEGVLLETTGRGVAASALQHALKIERVVTADELPAHAGELLSASQSYVENEIAAQCERDVNMLVRRLRNTAIEVRMAADLQGISPRAALIQRSTSAPVFATRDRGGRAWPSPKLIRMLWRQHLVDAFNETVLAALAQIGQDRARLHHTDPNHAQAGALVALLPGGALPTYADLRETVFHPNSEAWLGPVED